MTTRDTIHRHPHTIRTVGLMLDVQSSGRTSTATVPDPRDTCEDWGTGLERNANPFRMSVLHRVLAKYEHFISTESSVEHSEHGRHFSESMS